MTWLLALTMTLAMPQDAAGLFDNAVDVGSVQPAGHSACTGPGVYELSASGANIWGTADAFHFLHRELEGDATLTTEINWHGEGVNPHRKAGIMFRQSLDPGAPYVDAVAHGDGHLSLQYRMEAGGATLGINAAVPAPATLRLERDGALFTFLVAPSGAPFEPVATVKADLGDAVLAGLVLCSHDEAVTESAKFSNVTLEYKGIIPEDSRVLESTLETVEVGGEHPGRRRIVYRDRGHFEAPNWSRDGEYLIFNQSGRIQRVPVAGGLAELIPTGAADRCNNDHGLSPDGKWLAVSSIGDGGSRVYVLPSSGGQARLITPEAPSYWHGWSPDGKTLAYCARRNEEFDIYTIPAAGGQETRLTSATGLDDGPDYAPDGRIYFNSVRSGLMHIWRMDANGANQAQITSDDKYADWFPHPSPCGQWLVCVSFAPDVEGHPRDKAVVLRCMRPDGSEPQVLATLFGGQGTMNVPSWSPDSSRVAFVSYRYVAP